MKLHPILLGTSLFVFQLVLVLSICPESTWTAAWYSLASHWDSEWYAAIAQYGYVNLDGPAHCGLKNANVVFFPGYPYLARILALVLHLQAKTALLLVSQAAAWLFWCILFYILRSLSWLQQFAAAILILVFPTSWFLLMGYSESLFMETVCLTIWWMVKKTMVALWFDEHCDDGDAVDWATSGFIAFFYSMFSEVFTNQTSSAE